MNTMGPDATSTGSPELIIGCEPRAAGVSRRVANRQPMINSDSECQPSRTPLSTSCRKVFG